VSFNFQAIATLIYLWLLDQREMPGVACAVGVAAGNRNIDPPDRSGPA
jgi:hypothetical protein